MKEPEPIHGSSVAPGGRRTMRGRFGERDESAEDVRRRRQRAVCADESPGIGYFYLLFKPDLNACSVQSFRRGWGGLETEATSNTRTSPRARRHFGQLLSREKWPFDHGKNRFKACFGAENWRRFPEA